MAIYRQSRNIEASLIDYLKTNFDSDWGNVEVVKTFSKVYGTQFDQKTGTALVCVRVGTTDHEAVEIGSNSTRRTVQVLIDLFCTHDGQRLDLKDYTIGILKSGLIYYDYIIVSGQTQSKTANGRISVLEMEDVPVNFTENKDALDPKDRYRHLITLQISIGKVEV